MSLWSRLVKVLRNDRLINEIDEELESHIAEAIDRGRDPEEARRAFGARLQQREASRDIRRVVWLGDLLMDTRYAFRTLLRQPGFFLAAVLSLGLGIGANAAIFSVIDAVLVRSLPVSHPEQLVTVSDSASGGNFSYPDYRAMRQGTRTLSDLIAASFMVSVLVTESLLLAVIGGALGILLGAWGSDALVRLPLGDRPVILDVGLNLRMVVFTGAVSIVAGILFSLLAPVVPPLCGWCSGRSWE